MRRIVRRGTSTHYTGNVTTEKLVRIRPSKAAMRNRKIDKPKKRGTGRQILTGIDEVSNPENLQKSRPILTGGCTILPHVEGFGMAGKVRNGGDMYAKVVSIDMCGLMMDVCGSMLGVGYDK